MSENPKVTPSEEDVIKNGVAVFLYLTQDPEDRDVFAYIAVPLQKLKQFANAARKKGLFRLSDYGKVIASGYGEPADEVKKYVEELTGMSAAKFSVVDLKGNHG